VLRSLAILCVITAAVIAVAGIVGAVWSLFGITDTMTGKLIGVAASLAAAFILCVWTLALAEMIKLFIDIEHNTRVAAGSPAVTEERMFVAGGDGKVDVTAGHTNRMNQLEEETAEAALFRGH
jgi:hypothetical protein